MTVLLGRQSAGTTSDFIGAGDTAAWKFVADVSGDLSVIKCQSQLANGTITAVDLGIYADSAGLPGARLASKVVDGGDASAQGAGVFQATLSSTVPIVSGTTYWLGIHISTANFTFHGDTSTNTYRES